MMTGNFLPKAPKALKTLLVDHDIAQSSLAQSIEISPAAISQIVNHGIWPKRNHQAIKTQLIAALVSKGISIEQITTAINPESTVTPTKQKEEEPMLLRKQTLTPAARKQFGLFINPFTSDLQKSSDLYMSPEIRYAREAMFNTAKHTGFIAVTAESGAGKSTLKVDLLDRIEREKLNIIVIEPYVLAAEDNDVKGKTLKSSHIAEAILYALAPLTNAKRSPEARFRQIHELLKISSRAGNQHVLIIEEAHSLPLPTLKHLKRFHELKNGFAPLLNVILIGQNELALKLSENNQEVREVVQRCEIITLEPIAPENLRDYLTHRCKSMGYDLSKLITQDGIEAIAGRLAANPSRRGQHNRSLLYPLAVGNFMTAALNEAADKEYPIVDADVVKEV